MRRSWLAIAIVTVLLSLAAPWLWLYLQTAHYNSGPFRNALMLEFAAAVLLAGFGPQWRAAAVGFAIVAAPRLPALILQRPAHNVLFPIFLGLSVGLLIQSLWLEIKSRPLPGSPASRPTSRWRQLALDLMPGGIVLGLSLLLARNVILYYMQTDGHWRWQDRELAPGMSANYGLHLALQSGWSLLGPALWVLSERLPGRRAFDLSGAFCSLARGLSLGFAASLAVFLLQGLFPALSSGISDQGLSTGRRPALFSDTGASTVLFPLLAMLACWYPVRWLHRKLAQSQSGHELLWPPLLHSTLYGLLLLVIFPYQGRGILLQSIAALLILPALYPQLQSTLIGRQSSTMRRAAIAGAMILALLLPLLAISRSAAGQRMLQTAPAVLDELQHGGIAAAVAILDPVRAKLFEASAILIREAPLTGGGQGSFVVGLMRLRAGDPSFAPENPPGLIPGLLLEGGAAAMLVFLFCLWLYCQAVRQVWQERGQSDLQRIRRAICLAPLAAAPAFLFGYHLVFAEVSALLLLWMLLDFSETARQNKNADH
ncbi:MAG: hypothetical protein K1X75_02290 [Leptospirales bacterium]|nr:hypothetical protein [Leptospirales bacterium]